MKSNLQFHYCYFLLSETKKKASYIGYSVNPCRRLRQHNGEIKKGAKKTKNGVPWNLGICVGGFPDRVSALRFEWAWQHPNICKATRENIESWRIVKTKKTPENKRILNKRQWSIQQRVGILLCMTTLEPWKNMNLTVFVFKDELENIIKDVLKSTKKDKVTASFISPNILNKDCLLMFLYFGEDSFYETGIKFFRCDYDTFREIQKPSFDCDSDSGIEDNSNILNPEEISSESSYLIKCSLCQKDIDCGRNYLEFPCCKEMSVHISCIQLWGEPSNCLEAVFDGLFPLKDLVAPLVPHSISCPCCFKVFDWENVKKSYIKATSISNKSYEKVEDSLVQKKLSEKENHDFEKNSQTGILKEEDLEMRIEKCGNKLSGLHENRQKDTLFSDDEFSEISQKCEFIDLTVDSD
ncbi:holiday junction URI domain nuclease [Cryptosporidium ubiquitum]|uniref:Structure-specific endonuclease subunit SLX1 homolog n=1 Tax=Cryptosporidium ubiquitum TaxID=857276 RepID=A0A1J4MB26_9CRYT|nr:holiday junction URI domain nuclease [Cryptosporidium ubiquitum]OII71425.1 holiday junction URI domain nuclease [Cryptosporidium ubiquitum]